MIVKYDDVGVFQTGVAGKFNVTVALTVGFAISIANKNVFDVDVVFVEKR